MFKNYFVVCNLGPEARGSGRAMQACEAPHCPTALNSQLSTFNSCCDCDNASMTSPPSSSSHLPASRMLMKPASAPLSNSRQRRVHA